MTHPQPGTEGLDFHLSDDEKSGVIDLDENGYAKQPGTEGLDFHLTPEDKEADAEVKNEAADALAEKTGAELDELAEAYSVSASGTKHAVALRLIEAGYPEGPHVTTDGNPA